MSKASLLNFNVNHTIYLLPKFRDTALCIRKIIKHQDYRWYFNLLVWLQHSMKQLNSSKLPSLIGGAYPEVAMAVGSTLLFTHRGHSWGLGGSLTPSSFGWRGKEKITSEKSNKDFIQWLLSMYSSNDNHIAMVMSNSNMVHLNSVM